METKAFGKIERELNELWELITTRQEWTATCQKPKIVTVFVAVDACTSTGRGILRYDNEGQVYQEIFYPNGVRDISFILETQIICEMLESLCECRHGARCTFQRGQAIRCASDCVAAIYCVLKFYSRNAKACDLLKAAWEWLQRHESELQMRFVQGISMAADQTSRLEPLVPKKIIESWERLQMITMELPRRKCRNDKTDPENE